MKLTREVISHEILLAPTNVWNKLSFIVFSKMQTFDPHLLFQNSSNVDDVLNLGRLLSNILS